MINRSKKTKTTRKWNKKGKPTWMGETWWGERRWTAVVVVVVDCCSSGFLSLLCLRSRLLSEPDAPVPPASPVDGDLVECFRRNELPKLLSRLSWRLWCRLPLHKGHTITTQISFFFSIVHKFRSTRWGRSIIPFGNGILLQDSL